MADEGILDTEVARKASEQLGDLEYSLPFQELLEKSPLFKAGFDPQNIYYEKEDLLPKDKQRKEQYDISGEYYWKGTAENLKKSYEKYKAEGRKDYQILPFLELATAIEKGTIPENDFISMPWYMIPGDRTTTKEWFDPDVPVGEKSVKQLSDPDMELSAHMHEFIHRALNTNPEFDEWRGENNIFRNKKEEALMGYISAKEFPSLKDYEYDRVLQYDIDLSDEKVEKKMEKLYNEAQQIAEDSLRKKDVKKALGFNEGGLVSINHITRRL